MTARNLEDLRSESRLCALTAIFAAALTAFAVQPSQAAESNPLKVAVFDFELDDKSAGGGVVDQDPKDVENLKLATEEARRMLAASGRYSIVDTDSAAGDVASAGGVQYCNGCEGPIANALGADQAMIGVVTRVSRTEFTLQIRVRDTGTGETVSNAFTGLRMGANYAWPRSVKGLLNKDILSAQRAN